MATDMQIPGAAAVSRTGDGLRAFTAPPSASVAVPPPVLGSTPAATDASSTPSSLEQALGELSARVTESGAELDFQVDDESGRVIVRIVDRNDGTVLRQMPSEEALRIAKALCRAEPHLIEVRA